MFKITFFKNVSFLRTTSIGSGGSYDFYQTKKHFRKPHIHTGLFKKNIRKNNELVPAAIGSNCKNTKNHTRAVKFVWVTKCWTGTYLRFWVVERTFVWQIIRRRGFLGSTHKKIIELEGHTDNQIHTLISYTSPLSSRYLFYSISLNHLPVLLKTVPEDQAANYSCLTLLRVALVFKDHLLFKKILHHDALS